MSKEQRENSVSIIKNTLQAQDKEEERELDLASDEPDPPLPLTVTSRVLYMLGDITASSAYRFSQWLELVRKRSGKYRASGFPRRPHGLDTMPSGAGELLIDSKSDPPFEQAPEINLWERLDKVAVLDIESNSFSWDMLSSLHHTAHSGSEQSEDEMNKAQALELALLSNNVRRLIKLLKREHFRMRLCQIFFCNMHVVNCKFWRSCLLCIIQSAWKQ